jgi:DNA-binding transcriptional regulator YhcF (GntR family)
LILRVDPESHVPPYEQIRSQIAMMAATGVLPEGTRLPPIRQLARDLGLAGGTVARAYRELERAGVISTRGRHGTFVERATTVPNVPNGALDEAARSFAVRAAQLGADPQRAVESVRRALAATAAGSDPV